MAPYSAAGGRGCMRPLLELRRLMIADSLYIAMSPVLCGTLGCARTQLFKPLYSVAPAGFMGVAMLAVWTVNSQQRRQLTDPSSKAHNPLRPWDFGPAFALRLPVGRDLVASSPRNLNWPWSPAQCGLCRPRAAPRGCDLTTDPPR